MDLVLEEYRTLREESLQAMRQQQLILQLGLAALGVLVSVGIRSSTDTTVAALLLMGLIPLLSVLIVLIWAGELERMVRAGTHLRRIERRMNHAYEGCWPLQWESLLGTPLLPRIHGIYRAVLVALLSLLGVGAASIGAVRLGEGDHWVWMAALTVADSLIFVGTFVWWKRTERRLADLGSSTPPSIPPELQRAA